jgi:hypothetical protein
MQKSEYVAARTLLETVGDNPNIGSEIHSYQRLVVTLAAKR